ncbi:MAG TPA: hypothetical protein P5191_14820 [Ruminococcus sp.]|nr:hypothetical protein [Ruminococcus sp.]
MKKNDINKMFDNVNTETVEKIAAEYPTGDKKHRDRVYKEVERRVDGKYSAGEEVRGVETYRPRPYLRFVSAAAAVVVTAGAVGGGYLMLNKGSKSSDNIVPASQIAETVEVTDPLIPTDTVADIEELPSLLTKDELIEKINNRSYENYGRLNIEYSLSRSNGASIEHGIAMRDGITGNESFTKTWTHSEDYFKDMDLDAYDIDELMKEENTCNEMFFYKDLFICIYSNGTSEPKQYEVTNRKKCTEHKNIGRSMCFLVKILPYLYSNRSDWKLDDPTVFRDLYSENIAVDLELYDMDDTTSSTVYLGRQCTEARIYADIEELMVRQQNKYDLGHPEAITEPGDLNKDHIIETIITVDNETGFILRAVTTIDDYQEEFEIEDIRFDEDAELPPDAATIRKKLEGCVPNCEATAEYDLSILDEDAAGAEETTDEDRSAEIAANEGKAHKYEVNSKGQTYDGASYTISEENIDKLPDYICVGINGGKESGYINTREFLNTFVDCEAAFDMQEVLNNISDTAVSVDVNIYDEEGSFLRTLTFYTEPANLK